MPLTTAEQMVELLKSAGIRRIYGVTGDRLNFLIGLSRYDKISRLWQFPRFAVA